MTLDQLLAAPPAKGNLGSTWLVYPLAMWTNLQAIIAEHGPAGTAYEGLTSLLEIGKVCAQADVLDHIAEGLSFHKVWSLVNSELFPFVEVVSDAVRIERGFLPYDGS